jgi:hypothetical protein
MARERDPQIRAGGASVSRRGPAHLSNRGEPATTSIIWSVPTSPDPDPEIDDLDDEIEEDHRIDNPGHGAEKLLRFSRLR